MQTLIAICYWSASRPLVSIAKTSSITTMLQVSILDGGDMLPGLLLPHQLLLQCHLPRNLWAAVVMQIT